MRPRYDVEPGVREHLFRVREDRFDTQFVPGDGEAAFFWFRQSDEIDAFVPVVTHCVVSTHA